MLAGKKTYLGIALLTVAGLAGLDLATTGEALGLGSAEIAIAQALAVIFGAALAAYGRWKAGKGN